MVLVEQDVVGRGVGGVAQHGVVDGAAQVRVDGGAVAGGELGEHVLAGGDDFVVVGLRGRGEEEGFELRLDVVVGVGKGPAFGVAFGGDEGVLEGGYGVAGLDGRVDGLVGVLRGSVNGAH